MEPLEWAHTACVIISRVNYLLSNYQWLWKKDFHEGVYADDAGGADHAGDVVNGDDADHVDDAVNTDDDDDV